MGRQCFSEPHRDFSWDAALAALRGHSGIEEAEATPPALPLLCGGHRNNADQARSRTPSPLPWVCYRTAIPLPVPG